MINKLSTRFAPSPTGFLHLGNCRLALIGYLWAKKNSASYLLRFDDTDQVRSKQEYILAIENHLNWIGIDFDDKYKQSDNSDLYWKDIDKLIAAEKLYPCFETPEELNLMRKSLIAQGQPPIYDRSSLSLSKQQIMTKIDQGLKPHYRYLLDHKDVSWNDLAKGKITINTSHLSDPVLIRGDQIPLYTITSVCDDISSNISHIIRGEDHITNTAIQLEIFKSLTKGSKKQLPQFAHIPLVSSGTGSNLSKRLGSLSLKELKEDNYLPQAIFGYLATLGSNYQPLGLETKQYWIENFDFKNYSQSSPKFDRLTLDTINNKFFKNLPFEIVSSKLQQKNCQKISQATWDILKDTTNNFLELVEWINIIQNSKHNMNDNLKLEAGQTDSLKLLLDNFAELDFSSSEQLKKSFEAIKKNKSFNSKNLFLALRLALTKKKNGPKIFDILFLLGEFESKKRITNSCLLM